MEFTPKSVLATGVKVRAGTKGAIWGQAGPNRAVGGGLGRPGVSLWLWPWCRRWGMGPSQVFRGQGGLANWRTGGIT